jgi:hypothetical protein
VQRADSDVVLSACLLREQVRVWEGHVNAFEDGEYDVNWTEENEERWAQDGTP